MNIQGSYRFLIKRWGIALFCLFSGFMPILAQPFIDQQPISERRCESQGTVIFSVIVHGDVTDYDFRWYEKVNSDWVSIDGPPGAGWQYTPPLTTATYMCIVTEKDTKLSEMSNEATLTVDKAPTVTGISSLAVCDGELFTASVDGVNINGQDLISYEWKLHGLTIPGATNGSGTPTGNAVPNLSFVANAAQNNQFLTITVENACGFTTYPLITSPYAHAITVHSIPLPPDPIVRDYCVGENALPLSIESGNTAVWYNMATGGQIISTPTPNTNTAGIQRWWVSQKIVHTDPGNPTCESARSEAVVEVFSKPEPPDRIDNIPLCVNDPGITLDVLSGNNIKWYNDIKAQLTTAPQINTSRIETQVYYVTQSNGKCESTIDDGRITVLIRDRANADNIVFSSFDPNLCPNSSIIIDVSASASVSNPIFRWYAYSNKTGDIATDGNGSVFETPILQKDTAYYVSIEYGGLCESSYTQAAVLFVRDITPPEFRDSSYAHTISILPHKVVNTNDNVCYATVSLDKPRALDKCTDEPELIFSIGSTDVSFPLAPSDFDLGDSTLIWWVRDKADNADYALQTISVRDAQKPWTATPVEDVIKEIDEHENSAIVFYDWQYEDNCTPASELIDSLHRGLPSGSLFPLGETQIIRYIFDKAGNVDTCMFKVIVRHPYRPMEVALRISANPICPGKEVVITPIISGGSGKTTFVWNQRSWTAQVMSDYPLRNTFYEVTVDDGLTSVTRSVDISVLETRPVQLTLTVGGRAVSMDEIFEGDEVLVTATPGFDAYKLLLNNETIQEAGINNYLSFQANLGVYVAGVFATDENYCVTQDQMLIEVESRKLPNVFTPNFDGKNDIFLEFLEIPNSPKDFELQVFSRANELIYKGNKGWDGTYKGKVVAQGTYLYVVRRKMNNGEFRIFKGNVTIKL